MRKERHGICFLIKVFTEEKHAREFIRGALFARRLSYFKQIDGSNIRKDGDEGTFMLPRERAVLDLAATDPATGKVVTSTRITGCDLVAPISIQPRWTNHLNLFCMYAVLSCDLKHSTGNNNELTAPEGVLKAFGGHGVIVRHVPEFFKRIKDGAAKQSCEVKGRLVTYYDAEIGMPRELALEDAVFAKRNEYRHEQEFRVAIKYWHCR